MDTTPSTSAGPNLAQGIPASDLLEGRMLAGHVGEEAVLLARSGAEVFAIGATCTHYGAPLADGLMVGDTVRCPWHHACFSLRTGEALHAPAFAPVTRWTVEQRDGRIFVQEGLRLPPGQHTLHQALDRPRGSSSSVAVPPGSPQPKLYAAKATVAALSC